MTDRPIIFNAPMVRALLDGRKTQTRRLLKPQPVVPYDPCSNYNAREYGTRQLTTDLKAPHSIGDRLWVRETFGISSTGGNTLFNADYGFKPLQIERWKPSIHMPRWASRLTLTVTDVQVQRLQGINKDDALAEGVHPDEQNWAPEQIYAENMPAHLFGMLWDSINAARAPWNSNPWIAAYTFTVEKRNIDEGQGK